MDRREHWNNRYDTHDLPWDSGRHDRSMAAALAETGLESGRVLEIGCGTGSNAVWLAGKGFDVTAVDISTTAVERARKRGQESGVDVTWHVIDVLEDELPSGPFDLVVDRGCFHSMPETDDRVHFADTVRARLVEAGLWISLIGSTDGPEREKGPPRLSAREVTEIVEPRFEILSMKAGHFDSDSDTPAPAWICVFRERT